MLEQNSKNNSINKLTLPSTTDYLPDSDIPLYIKLIYQLVFKLFSFIIFQYYMLSNILIAPSLNSLLITGFLLLSIFFIFFANFQQFKRLDFYRKLTILSLITIAIGVHGLIHLGVETTYNFNPYKWV